MKTKDYELLKRAAAAAGMRVQLALGLSDNDSGFFCDGKPWDPLADDGDALRLAVKLRFHINIFSACTAEGIDSPGFVEIWHDDSDPIHVEHVSHSSDYEAAARHAIVRAAARVADLKTHNVELSGHQRPAQE